MKSDGVRAPSRVQRIYDAGVRQFSGLFVLCKQLVNFERLELDRLATSELFIQTLAAAPEHFQPAFRFPKFPCVGRWGTKLASVIRLRLNWFIAQRTDALLDLPFRKGQPFVPK